MSRMRNKDENFLHPGDIIFNKYQVTRLLTEGGMKSQLYLGFNLTLLNPSTSTDDNLSKVVIKIVKRVPEMSKSAWIKSLEELVTASRVHHPNLVQTYDIAKHNLVVKRNNQNFNLNDVAVIVMENVQGPTLRLLITNKGYFSVDEAMYYFKKMVLGIRRLHTYSHMIIHRDLKPENILLSPDLREVKILDFGISSTITTHERVKLLTDEQALFGTVEYMIPDNLDKEIDPKTGRHRRVHPTPQFDFYSLGVILYEMLTGEKPFVKVTSGDPKKRDELTIQKARTFDMPIMRGLRADIPNSIENLVFRCIASKSEDIMYRYNSADEILKDIETYNLPERFDEKLIKPAFKRLPEGKNNFNPVADSLSEKFYYKKWMFILVTAGLVIFAIFLVVLFILVFVQ